VGGYGGLGIIIDAEFVAVEDEMLIRKTFIRPREETIDFLSELKQDSDLVFYNGNNYPGEELQVAHICYFKVESKTPTPKNNDLISPNKGRMFTLLGEQILKRIPFTKTLRAQLELKDLQKPLLIKRSEEMSRYDANNLELFTKIISTDLLQEYFIPLPKIDIFLNYFWRVVNHYDANLINVSLRYIGPSSDPTKEPILAYTKSSVETISVVIYFNMYQLGFNTTKEWSQLLIQKALDLGGSYYLPYLHFASTTQFQQAYPQWLRFLELKNKYDPLNVFSNLFLKKYFELEVCSF
jgi:hypothetical protein